MFQVHIEVPTVIMISVDEVRQNLSGIKKDAFESLGVFNNGIDVVPAPGTKSGNNIVFPFSRKKNIKFESLIEENLIISPYFNCNTKVDIDQNGKQITSTAKVVPHPTISCEWPVALVSNYEYQNVLVDSLESYGSVWRIMKSKSNTSGSISASGNYNSYDATNTAKYIFQCCVSIVCCLFLYDHVLVAYWCRALYQSGFFVIYVLISYYF